MEGHLPGWRTVCTATARSQCGPPPPASHPQTASAGLGLGTQAQEAVSKGSLKAGIMAEGWVGLTSEDVALVVVVSSSAHTDQATQPLRVHEFRHQVLVLLGAPRGSLGGWGSVWMPTPSPPLSLTWKICFSEKRERRSSGPLEPYNFSARGRWAWKSPGDTDTLFCWDTTITP